MVLAPDDVENILTSYGTLHRDVLGLPIEAIHQLLEHELNTRRRVQVVLRLHQRFNRLRLKALDREGKPYELLAEGLLAQAIQHEIDHLDGKLYIDYLSSLKRERYKKKRAKAEKYSA